MAPSFSSALFPMPSTLTLCLAAITVALLGVLSNPKRFALALLTAYKQGCKWMLRARGVTPEGAAAQRVVSGVAWDEFCDSLKAAGAIVMGSGAPMDPLTQAEGYRYLSRLARAGLENFLECSDPLHPRLTSIVDGRRPAPIKLGNDNPDNKYQQAVIDGSCAYRLTGNVGTVHYLGFGTQVGSYGKDGGLRTVDYRERGELTISPSGDFDITLSSIRPPNCDNWLRLQPEPRQAMVIIRQTFLNHSTEVPATVHIQRVGCAGEGGLEPAPEPLSCCQLDAALSDSMLLVGGAAAMFAAWASGFRRHCNALPLFDQATSDRAGGDPNIRYYHSYWEVGPEDALVIEMTPPPCDYWNFQLSNHWMESLDYRYHKVHVNNHTAVADAAGRVRIVVARDAPQTRRLDNWLDTCHHPSGAMCLRWVKPHVPDSLLPRPRTRVVHLCDL